MELIRGIPHSQEGNDAQLSGYQIETRTSENAAISARDHPLVEIWMESGNSRSQRLVVGAVNGLAEILASPRPTPDVIAFEERGWATAHPSPTSHGAEDGREAKEKVALQNDFFNRRRRACACGTFQLITDTNVVTGRECGREPDEGVTLHGQPSALRRTKFARICPTISPRESRISGKAWR